MSESHEDANASAPPKKRSCLRLFLVFFAVVGVVAALVVVGAGVAGYLVYDSITRPGVAGRAVRVTIPEGATGQEVAVLLKEAGLIEHEMMFRAAIQLDGGQKTAKHGDYDLPLGLSPMQLLDLLHKGPTPPSAAEEIPDHLKVTIPEGLAIPQIAALFDHPEAFIEAASSPELIARLGLKVETLEGFLMPNTYFFSEKPTEREVVERMFGQFEKEFTRLSAKYPRPANIDLLSLVTVASLVEEEARVDDERPIVAAVIYNRLKKRMPLELDSTLQFALNKYGQRMLNEDKEVDSPYNTYKNPGLPPGPISNPGRASLEAALNPVDEDYLFFVSNADGKTHTFSKTIKEHNRAVARFRKEIAAQRREQRDRSQAEQPQ